MKVCGIPAEFNPFHNGHARLIRLARESGFTHVVAVMSGNFVQRGEPAITGAGIRAAQAVRGGADLVLQLPVTFALSGASGFARGCVEILNSTGVVDSLVFGSECGDTGLIEKCAAILSEKDTDYLIAEELKSGISYAGARERALEKAAPELSHLIREPNNILAVEYVNALKNLGSGMTPVTFRRNIAHDSACESGGYASASAIRRIIKEGGDYSAFVPGDGISREDLNIVDYNRFEAAVLCNMRKMAAEEIAGLPDISEGLENRIFAASRRAASLEDLYSEAKTKRYSHARIRRIVMCAFTGITSGDCACGAPYIRPLAMNGRGAELLALMKDTASLPVVSKTSDIAGLGENAKRIFSLECAATDIFAACLSSPLPPGTEKDRKPVIIS